MISEYAESLAGKLGFDHSLSQRVRQEVEDHLREAVAADSLRNRLEAERRAIANFGDPRVIAAQFAVASLAHRTRNVGLGLVVVIAGVFLAMKARLAWYALTQWALSDELRAISAIVGSIDRYAFWFSIAAGIACWATIRRRAPAAFDPSYRRQLRRFFLLCSIATAGLIVAVIGDGILTALRFLGTEWSAGFLIPVFSMAIEIVFASVLVFHLRGAVRRMAATSALLGAVPSD